MLQEGITVVLTSKYALEERSRSAQVAQANVSTSNQSDSFPRSSKLGHCYDLRISYFKT